MWEIIVQELLKNIVVPELARYIRNKYETTGEWPTKEELEAKLFSLAEDIKRVGNDFLNRPTITGTTEIVIPAKPDTDGDTY